MPVIYKGIREYGREEGGFWDEANRFHMDRRTNTWKKATNLGCEVEEFLTLIKRAIGKVLAIRRAGYIRPVFPQEGRSVVTMWS